MSPHTPSAALPDTDAADAAPTTPTDTPASTASETAAAAPRQRPVNLRNHPLLAQLAQWYPHLFGQHLLPLKRGIFHDLLAAHPDAIDKAQLKLALAWHTRSTRYLSAVASGQQRHDLQGKAVEAVAPEHLYQALVESFRRRQQRNPQDMSGQLQQRIAKAFEASGLSREAYAEMAHNPRNEAANAVLEAALDEASTRIAKDEALLRTFETSGHSEAAFADMYGMPLRQVSQTLTRARRRRKSAAAS